jgi:hypothetical protein
MEIVKRLANFANKLDKSGLGYMGDVVDGIAQRTVRVSQYVGVQGYWVRNERCWSNCYRQKRASKPSLSAQQVWEECQEEFQASINNDGSKWDKYAGDDSFVKTAQFKADNAKLAEIIKISGNSLPSMLLKLSSGEVRSGLIADANEMSQLAMRLGGVDAGLAREAAEISIGLAKEAQFFSNVGNFFRGVGNSVSNGIRNQVTKGALLAKVKQLTQQWQQISQAVEQFNVGMTEAKADLNARLQSKSPKAVQMANQALSAINSLNKLNINSSAIQQVSNMMLQLNNIAQGIESADPNAGGQQPAPAATPPSTPASTPPPAPSTPPTPTTPPATPPVPSTPPGPSQPQVQPKPPAPVLTTPPSVTPATPPPAPSPAPVPPSPTAPAAPSPVPAPTPATPPAPSGAGKMNVTPLPANVDETQVLADFLKLPPDIQDRITQQVEQMVAAKGKPGAIPVSASRVLYTLKTANPVAPAMPPAAGPVFPTTQRSKPAAKPKAQKAPKAPKSPAPATAQPPAPQKKTLEQVIAGIPPEMKQEILNEIAKLIKQELGAQSGSAPAQGTTI